MKRKSNTILLAILAALLILFVATRIFRTPARMTNLDVGYFAIDTALIHTVKLKRPDKPELKLIKTDSNWIVSENDRLASVGKRAIGDLMSTLLGMKPERVVSRSQDKWESYEVTDSASIHLTAYDSDEEPVIDWFIGKESAGNTYLRATDASEVYAMTGMLRSRVDDDFNQWRDKRFLRIVPEKTIKVTFQYPADSGFTITRNGGPWMLDQQKADSSSVVRYLTKLSNRNLNDFAEEIPSTDPDITITFESDSGHPAVVSAWRSNDDSWIFRSSLQKDAYFLDSRIDDDLFAWRRKLLGQ